MIIGIGTDIVQIPRIERILSLYKDRFVKRILSEVELQKFASLVLDKHANFLAKRFAAKEAISKALGTGIGKYLQFKDITIFNDDLGKPFAKIIANSCSQHFLVDCFQPIEQITIHLSLADDYPVSIAFAIITKQTIIV